jgi:hypothetical protein
LHVVAYTLECSVSRRTEHLPGQELNPDLVKAYSITFIQRRDCYPKQIKNGAYICIKRPLNQNLLEAHIKGRTTLGAYALDTNSWARWLCFDADDDDQFSALKVLSSELAKDEVVSYIESSRRGGHLWLFTQLNPGKSIRQFGKSLAQKYDLGSIEIYPKQDELKTGPGSLVRLPLGIHQKSGKRYHFIQLNGQPLAPTIRQQMAVLATPALVPQTYIEQIANEYVEPSSTPPKPTLFDTFPALGNTLSERLKSSISVLDFVSRYVVLDERTKGICPFHDDHVKSFQVNEQANYWHCYAGCGGGSIIDFWSRWREIQGQDGSFIATITELAQVLL